ncbi:uncharacterized protein LOC105443730 [Strongylocentrotus purpuratus]|uniref:Uncharacterized protein n=1 Tax=Strongylocentrotus purpuratus TaxID=7668 RepID=A0A7M7LTH3_STRPU|nr:uncharacterized protein LOC105443730 [Strongylocentrotus purpuratus]|eukprot:XP_011675575.1 PREDICTED: uncharacterized protein LOC105443730 [Strongylocentrotus purpuratus]
MATLVTFICLLAACCIVAEAHKNPITNIKAKPELNPVGPPQKQTMFDFPVDQGTGPSFAGPSIGGPSTAGSSLSYMIPGSSSEEVSDVDMEMDADINDVDSVLSFVFGRNGNQISGNMRPLLPGNGRQRVMSGVEAGEYDQLKGRTSGSSGRGVGIAFGVLGLLALVVAAAFFTIRRYRQDIPVLVRT